MGAFRFRKGRIAGAAAPSTASLGELLVRNGKLTAEALASAGPARDGTLVDAGLADRLVQLGLVDVATVHEARPPADRAGAARADRLDRRRVRLHPGGGRHRRPARPPSRSTPSSCCSTSSASGTSRPATPRPAAREPDPPRCPTRPSPSTRRARVPWISPSWPALKLGNYRLERVIGRGRMGVVYLAQDEALLRPTAIKVLAWASAETRGQDPVQWFLGEARLVARINDPRVVQIYGAARAGRLLLHRHGVRGGPVDRGAHRQGGPAAARDAPPTSWCRPPRRSTPRTWPAWSTAT